MIGNFFTIANDWRRMGAVSCADFRVAPFQIDGNIGFPAAVHEMLLQSRETELNLLPALPDKWEQGHIRGLAVRGNIRCDIEWENDRAHVTLRSKEPKKCRITAGSGFDFVDGSSVCETTVGESTVLELYRK